MQSQRLHRWVIELNPDSRIREERAYDYDLGQPAPATPLTEGVRAAAPRGIIADTFTRAKGQGGLDHDAVRS